MCHFRSARDFSDVYGGLGTFEDIFILFAGNRFGLCVQSIKHQPKVNVLRDSRKSIILLHLEWGFPLQMKQKSWFSRNLVKYPIWAYVLCFKNIVQIDFQRKVRKWLPKVPKSFAHVIKNHVHLKTVFSQNLCSSLWFSIGFEWKIHGIPIKK